MRHTMIGGLGAMLLSACAFEGAEVDSAFEEESLGTARDELSWGAGDTNDTIYFGYCETCHGDDEPGLLICKDTGGVITTTTRALDTTSLYIRGMGGNDHIQALHEGEKLGCTFGDFTKLTFSRVVILGGEGNDTLIGTTGSQTLYGENGDDYLSAYSGDDHLYGGNGKDYLLGDQGNDSLYGQNDNDILVGGTGDDLVNGGDGNDSFHCRQAASPTAWDGGDHATDCGDTRGRDVENVEIRDPYLEWARMTRHKHGVLYHHTTTSNPSLLLSDRAAGASILIGAQGDIPIAGDLDSDGSADDVGVYRVATTQWYLDYNHNGTSNAAYSGWGARGDRPIVGDFDLDGETDDVAVFRPSNRRWYFDDDHDGTTDDTSGPWGIAGDIPLAGDFDRDGRVNDIAVFRPATETWYFDYNHDGTTNETRAAWGDDGDIPLAGDFDRDGQVDDVAVFRPSNRMWYFDYGHDGTTNETRGPWGLEGDIPIAGDFDRDGRMDDAAVFRTSENTWLYDYDHNGTTDMTGGPWGAAGEPLGTTHKQYGASCGPTSLNMVMEYLGKTDPAHSLCFRRDLDLAATSVSCSGFPGTAIDVGYELSMEHILFEGFHRARDLTPTWNPGASCMDALGKLSTADGGTGEHYDIRYDIGHVDWDPATGSISGDVQRWAEACGAVGWDTGSADAGLPWVANAFSEGANDALPISTEIGAGKSFASLDHMKAVIRGFIDHNLPVVAAVESGGHFNTLMGYQDLGGRFYIYLADPLDGWGRPYYGKPMRWRKILLGNNALEVGSGTFVGMMLYGHGGACSGANNWAATIDATHGRSTLCGYL